MQFILGVIFSLLSLPMAISQVPDPIQVYVKNSGSSYIDQFTASTNYAFGIVEDVSPQLGIASISIGSANTLKVMFTPSPGAVGSSDLIVTYYTDTDPALPRTKWYRFNVGNEIVAASNDRFVVDMGSVDIPLDVLQNDSASAGNLTLSTVSVLNNGTASITAGGDTILFTPDVDFTGDTWIQYIACDDEGHCGQGNAHVLVRDPGAQDHLSYRKYLLNQEPLEVITPFADFAAIVSPSHGSLDSINPVTWVYTAESGYVGNDTFKLDLTGLISREYIVTVYKKEVNVEAKDDRFYVRPGLSVSFNVLNNDLLDFDLVSHTNPTKGVLSETGNGVFTYTSNGSFRGVDKFTYTACYQDTVYCETATVLIHVTDLEPENTFSYDLQTSKDLPLTLDYPIIYTDFSYIISGQPDHGQIIDYAGLQNIDLPCDTIESYNMLVYEPDAGYTGPDHFEYYYCIQPTNLCYLVKVDMNVIDAPETESCACIVDCVWPGDADLDGRVDMTDLLTMGYKLGETGYARDYNDPAVWFGQHATPWDFSGNGPGYQYIDANGDGAITAADVDLIDANYYRAHDVVVKDVQQKLPYQFSLIPVQFSLDSGDVVILDVALGNANVPVYDMKGVKFSVNVPAWMLDSSSVQVDFHHDSWLSEGTPFISLAKVPWDGRIDAGYSKANGNGATGFGVIATIVFIIEDDAEGFKSGDGILHIPVSLQSGTAMGSDGELYELEGAEIVLDYDLHGVNNDKYNLLVYPNPATDLVDIHLNGKTTISSVQVVDPQGRVIRTYGDIDDKHFQMDVASLPVGLYYLQVNHTHGVETQLLSVIR